MTYILLNLIATCIFVTLTFFLDKKLVIDSKEPSTFSITLLTATVESFLYTIFLAFKSTWLVNLSTPLLSIIMSFEGILFVNFSFAILSLSFDTKKFWSKILKYALCILAVFISFIQFKSYDLSIEKGMVIASEYLFSGDARTYFPWTWVSVYNAFYKFILPIFSVLFLAIYQEKNASQIQKYQTFIIAEGIALMWVVNFYIKFIATQIPSFSLLFPFSYILLFIVTIMALTKKSVPSGKGILVSMLKIVLSYVVPGVIIGIGFAYFQPEYSIIGTPYLIAFIFASIAGIIFALWISDLLGSSSKIYTTDYEHTLEKALASVNYQNASMDEVTNKMKDILKRNVESSSLNVYILTNQNELDTAYSSNKMSQKISANNPIFDHLLNNNINVVIYQQIEKDHAVAPIAKELEEFFNYTKSDALFILNEGHNIFGLITLGKKASGDHYKEYDYNVFTKLYSYFFVFGYYMRNISNKDIIDVVNREIKMSSQIITSIQENIDHIKNPKVDTGYMMVPSHNIGGEFIDLIRLTDTRHLFVVGDLSGKGIAASMNMVILKSIIRTYLSETHDFKELVTKVNTFVRDSLRKGTIFAGLFALIDFETDTMYYINCGIPALMMYTQVYNNVIEIQGSGHVLGFVKDISPYLSVKTIKLNRGDIILACTDGLINSHSLRGEQFGKERVQQALLDNSTYPAQRMAQFTFESLLKFMSKEMEDDVSILVLKYEYSVEYYEEETENQENEEETTEDSSTEEATAETSQISENDSIPEERAEPSIEPSVDNSLNSEENLMAAAGLPDFGDFVMPSMDSVEPFDIEESVTKQAAVEEKATTEDIASSFGDDFGLPDDFDMSSLEGLDDLINKSDLG